MSYGFNALDQLRQAAGYVDRILKGEKPADLPVQAPTKYELVINLKTAKALGLTVPASVLVRADAIIVGNDTAINVNLAQVVELAARHKLPAAYLAREFVDGGGLMMYGVNYPDLYRRAATYVDKILKGAKPGDLPVEQPTKFELVINRKTAKALGLTIPPVLLLRADQVIE